MFEQLSTQAREVVSYHERNTLAREEQFAAQHAREAVTHAWQEAGISPADAEAQAARMRVQGDQLRQEATRAANPGSPVHTIGTTGATGSWGIPTVVGASADSGTSLFHQAAAAQDGAATDRAFGTQPGSAQLV